jgi:hypothetical protein
LSASFNFKIVYRNFVAYPSCIQMETQAKIDETISEEIKNDFLSSYQKLEPLYAVERLQNAKIVLQNKLTV